MALDIYRTPDSRFAGLPDYPFAPHYHQWDRLRMHYVDEGGGKPILLLHGEPTWSYLYRRMIPPLVEAGYRAIAPDFIGFGKSDKVTDDSWYVAERHVESIRSLIETLDLGEITVVVQDWGGPIGLRQAVDMPGRFERLVILNTWLHHAGAAYTGGIEQWREFVLSRPDLPCGKAVARSLRTEGHDLQAVQDAYDAPFPDQASKAGARRFPWFLPQYQPEEGNAADQERCWAALRSWTKPAHVIFSDSDVVFTADLAKQWAKHIPRATLDFIEGPGHFLQEERGAEIAACMLRRFGGA
ncbi:MAG: alpha/beta fold hydrolase [bacterium]|nr:alpha/beta fold hydrolase [bacterium]